MLRPIRFRAEQAIKVAMIGYFKVASGYHVIGNQYKQKSHWIFSDFLFGDPLGARTQDPNIKSVVLYLLS